MKNSNLKKLIFIYGIKKIELDNQTIPFIQQFLGSMFMNLQASNDAFSPLKSSSKETKVWLAVVYVRSLD
jgi:hypothetical protein